MINKIIYILLFIFSYSYMQANERSGYILAGTVRDSQTKEVLSFATLQLIAENKTSYGVITDSNGRYHFANLPVGKYTFRVSFLGYDKKEEILQVKGDVALTIDMESNTVNDEKSIRFTEAMTKKGFCFPAVKIAGNPTTRKEYDEGSILLDANRQLFHLKQAKSCPYIRAIQLPEGLQLKHLFITEFKSRKTLAFMTDVNNTLYILNNRTYDVVKAGISTFNPETDAISVFGNLFDWTIRVTTTASDKYYALNAVDYSLIKSMEYTSSESSFAEKAGKYIFPVRPVFTSPSDKFVTLRYCIF